MDDVQEIVCSFNSLYKAMYVCKQNVIWKDSVAGFVKNGLVNCFKLSNDLINDKYKIDKYSIFQVYEPKIRDIVSTRFKDRVFQRSLCDNYLYDEVTNSFIYDNCACQINKGTDFARDRLSCHMQRFFRIHGFDGYILKCDIKNYFGSTPHEIAKNTIKKRIDNEWVLNHVYKIIDSFNQGENPEIGMGLGSQITQLTQLAVLDDLDHFIKEKLKIKEYIRYMDDLILIHESKEYLKFCKNEIQNHIEKLGIKLNNKKTQIFPLKQGINFLGFKFHLTDTGKIIKKLNKENINNEKRKLKKLKNLVDKSVLTREHVDECFAAWKAHAKKGNTFNLLKNMDIFYNNLWEE